MIPKHVGLIPDGSRRWARAKRFSIKQGHEIGLKKIFEMVEYLFKKGVDVVTLWLFSTENWKRSEKERNDLFEIETGMIRELVNNAQEKGIKIIWAGRRDRIPDFFKDALESVEWITKQNKSRKLYLAIDYGGQDEISRAIARLGWLERYTADNFLDKYLDIKEPVDLIIRTSGEQRLSGFLAWQGTYAEFYFIKKHCPDLTFSDIDKALKNFSERKRRFGK